MKGRTATKAEQKYMDDCRELGCIVCLVVEGFETPPAIHHIDGKTKPEAHFNSIPLCYHHHQGSVVISRHGHGRTAFEEFYGKTEAEWLELTKERLSA